MANSGRETAEGEGGGVAGRERQQDQGEIMQEPRESSLRGGFGGEQAVGNTEAIEDADEEEQAAEFGYGLALPQVRLRRQFGGRIRLAPVQVLCLKFLLFQIALAQIMLEPARGRGLIRNRARGFDIPLW